jgi:hypothetical protein
MTSIGALSLRIPVWHPTLIGLDLPLASLISITDKKKNILTCTQETTRAKLEQLRSARPIHCDQTIMTRHAIALNKANGLISLLAPTLSYIKHDFSHPKLISMIRFASYSKHANASIQILINIKGLFVPFFTWLFELKT